MLSLGSGDRTISHFQCLDLSRQSVDGKGRLKGEYPAARDVEVLGASRCRYHPLRDA